MTTYNLHVLTDALPLVQPGLSEDELGGSEEVHQRSDQQSQRVEHRHDHPGAAAGEHRQGEVSNNTSKHLHLLLNYKSRTENSIFLCS